MDNQTEYVFAKFIAKEKQADGTYLVKGIVSDDGIDRDDQVCDAAWLDRAVPKWFGEGGNIREMHTLAAAGKAIEYWKAEGGEHWITAKVVDTGAVTKVEEDVLTGFSVGIKNARITKDASARNGRIVDGEIIEVSLVDRPCNPRALLTLAKSDSAGHIAPVEEQVLEEPEVPEEQPETDKADEPTPTMSEERRQAIQGVLDGLAELDLPTVDKADETADITEAQQAIAIIARLIQSEAEGLLAGDFGEAWDIGTLLEAVGALRCFIGSERSEQVEQAVADAMVGLNDDIYLADGAKAETADTEKADTGVEETDVVALIVKSSAASEWVQGIVEKAVAEAVAKTEETLGERLAKVEAAPTPGGPVRVRIPADIAKAASTDQQHLLQQAQEYEERASQTLDRDLADGFRAKAQSLRSQAHR